MGMTMPNDRLSRRENAVMNAVFTLAQGKERFLVYPYELLSMLPEKGYDEENVERILRSLELDGYLEILPTERKGEKTYVVCMREAGLAYRRYDAVRRRKLYFKLALTVACGLLSAAVGILLRALLS